MTEEGLWSVGVKGAWRALLGRGEESAAAVIRMEERFRKVGPAGWRGWRAAGVSGGQKPSFVFHVKHFCQNL